MLLVQKDTSSNHYRGAISANNYEKMTPVRLQLLFLRLDLHSCRTECAISANKDENVTPGRMH